MHLRAKWVIFPLLLILAGGLYATSINKEDKAAALANTKKDFAVCDIDKLTTTLKGTGVNNDNSFTLRYLADKEANYNYYLITDKSALNADAIRKATCTYIMDNKCYVYWGNVANIAMVAAQKAPWFPGDATPHYVISPYITCNKLIKKNGSFFK